MAISIWPVTDGFVAEVGDADLANLSDDEAATIKDAFLQYAVLIFPDQQLDHDQHLDFARRFGPLETTIATYRENKLRLRPEFADVSNLDGDDKVWGGESRTRQFQMANRLWHTDSTFKFVPARVSLLYARGEIPPVGGHTEFADQRAAYDALDAATRALIEGKVAEHAIFTSRGRLGFTAFTEQEVANLPPVPQVLVRTLATGRRSLYLASHAGRILGMDEAEGRALIDRLIAHTTQRRFVYTHRWRPRDLVMWDDRCTMHRGAAFDDLRWRRDVQRATVSDEINSCEREGVQVAAA
jgi:alpha-ketoglutarate-dependent 2,4-dichlorophenoxyacetate dioxygenase